MNSVSGFVAAACILAVGAMFMDQKTSDTAQSEPSFMQAAKAELNEPSVTAITADAQGHFMAAALVNGVHIDMLADTGATAVVLTEEDAERAGFDPAWLEYDVKMQTANGVTNAALITLDEVEVGQVRVRDVRALVAKREALAHSLLGMSFIGALTRFELKGDQLVLVQ